MHENELILIFDFFFLFSTITLINTSDYLFISVMHLSLRRLISVHPRRCDAGVACHSDRREERDGGNMDEMRMRVESMVDRNARMQAMRG